MPITPDPPFPKKQGDNIRSKDWNDAVNELIRLDTAKLTLASGGALAGALSINTPVNTSPVVNLKQTTPSWGTVDIYKDYRYIRTEFAGAGTDGPFRQFNVGAGGVSIGYPNVPTYGSTHALYVNGNVGIGTTEPTNAKLVISGVTSWNNGIGLTGNASGGVGMYFENTAPSGHKYSLLSGGTGNTMGVGGFGLYDDTVSAYRWAVDANGLLGVGTANPLTLLHIRKDVAGGLGPVLTVMNGGGYSGAAAAIDLSTTPTGTNPATTRIQAIDDGSHSGHITLSTKEPGAPTNTLRERVRLQSNGNLTLLANTNPLNVTSTWQGSPDNVTQVSEICNDTNYHYCLMLVGNRSHTTRQRRVGIWDQLFVAGTQITSSDLRLKEQVEPLSDSLASVLALRGVKFKWQHSANDDTPPTFGLIAQEVEKVFPELVEDGPDGMKALNYMGLIGPLVEAVKEQQGLIGELRAEVESLKSRREN